jgi:hypothetical protein
MTGILQRIAETYVCECDANSNSHYQPFLESTTGVIHGATMQQIQLMRKFSNASAPFISWRSVKSGSLVLHEWAHIKNQRSPGSISCKFDLTQNTA